MARAYPVRGAPCPPCTDPRSGRRIVPHYDRESAEASPRRWSVMVTGSADAGAVLPARCRRSDCDAVGETWTWPRRGGRPHLAGERRSEGNVTRRRSVPDQGPEVGTGTASATAPRLVVRGSSMPNRRRHKRWDHPKAPRCPTGTRHSPSVT